MKPVRVILLDNAKEEFERLNVIVGKQIESDKQSTEEMQLLNSIKQKINLIKLNPFYGDNLAKNLIPKEYNVTNLWRVELSQFWRMLYTIKGDQIEIKKSLCVLFWTFGCSRFYSTLKCEVLVKNLDIICFILDILSHPDYDKKFGYRKR